MAQSQWQNVPLLNSRTRAIDHNAQRLSLFHPAVLQALNNDSEALNKLGFILDVGGETKTFVISAIILFLRIRTPIIANPRGYTQRQ